MSASDHGGGHAGGHGDGHDDGHGHSRFIQHHYDDATHQFESGKLGIWFFLVQELLFFSGLFVAYILYRHNRPEIFAYAHSYLDVKWGAINTAVLIFSSLSAAWAVRCAQLGQRKALIGTLSVTIICAIAFLGIKGIEYKHKIHEGILFGRYFDPCVSAGGGPLLNKGNECEGTKSAIELDPSTGKYNGCLSPAIDQQPNVAGVQAVCKVSEITGTVAPDADGNSAFVETARRDIPACAQRIIGTSNYVTPLVFPCFELAQNPAVCPDNGGAALVRYGDHEERGETVRIEAECSDAPALSTANPYDMPSPIAGDVLGVGDAATTQPLTKHELAHEYSLGAPPEHTSMFFSIYFAMTGLHGIHVFIGILIYMWLLFRAVRGDFTPEYFGPVDYAALYWHLVDLIWIFLFPLLYLIH